MARFSVRMEIDLEIDDEAAARALAAEYVRHMHRWAEAQGASTTTAGGESPEVAVHAQVQDMKATASAVASAAFQRGRDGLAWLRVSRLFAYVPPDSDQG